MAQFMVEFQHTEDQCDRLFQEVEQSGELPDIYYGCAAGRHTAWAVIRAADEDDARNMIPAPLRGDAKIIPVEGGPG